MASTGSPILRGAQAELLGFSGVGDLKEPRMVPVLEWAVQTVVDLRIDRAASVGDSHDRGLGS
jgi:hypothetical protein